MPPPLLTLARIHRLLRPLRAALTALRAELDQHPARPPAAPAAAKSAPAKGKGKGKARAVETREDDEEWVEGPRRKRRKVGGGGKGRVGEVRKAGRQVGPALASSSPVRWRARDVGDNGAGCSTVQDRVPETVEVPKRRPSDLKPGSFDLPSYLRNHTSSPALIAKTAQLARCYTTILETCYPAVKQLSKSRSSSRRLSPARPLTQPSSPPGRAVLTLTELCARQVGIAIEDNVRLAVEEATELKETSLAASQELKRAGRQQRSRVASPDEEDATAFQDEWYAACPAYSLRHVLMEHATCIVVEGLEDAAYPIINAFFEVALASGANVEARRFWPALCQAGLTASTPPSSALSLLYRSQSTIERSDCLAVLEATLLESSFSDKLFYAPFLSLAHFQPSRSQARSAAYITQAVKLLEMEVRVGRMMLEAVAEAKDAGDRGGESIIRDIVGRLERELAAGLQLIVRGQAKHDLELEGDGELTASLFRLIDNSAQETSPLWPIAAAFELANLRPSHATDQSAGSISISRLRILDTLACDVSQSSDDGLYAVPGPTALLAALGPLLRYHTSSDFLAFSHALSDAGLSRLESALLERVVDGHDNLVDVRAARGGQVVDMAVLEHRLARATRANEPGASSVARARGHAPDAYLSSEASHPASQSYSPLLARSKLSRSGSVQLAMARRAVRPLFVSQLPASRSEHAEQLCTEHSDEVGGDDDIVLYGEGDSAYLSDEVGGNVDEGDREVEQDAALSPCRSRSSTRSSASNSLIYTTTDCESDSTSSCTHQPSPVVRSRPTTQQRLRRRATAPTTRHERLAAQPLSHKQAPRPRRRRSALPSTHHDDESSEDELLL